MGNDQCCAAKTEVRRELVDNLERYSLAYELKESLDRTEWEQYNLYFTIDNSVQLQRSGITLFRRPIQYISYLIKLTFKEYNITIKQNQQYSKGVLSIEEDIRNALELIFSNEVLKNFFIERIDDSQKDFSTAGNRGFISPQYLSRRINVNEQEYQSRQSYHLPLNAKSQHQQQGDNNNININSGSPYQIQDNQESNSIRVNPYNQIAQQLSEEQNAYIDNLMPLSTPHLPSEKRLNGQDIIVQQREDDEIIEQLTGKVYADPKSSQRIAHNLTHSKEIVSSIKDIQIQQPQILQQDTNSLDNQQKLHQQQQQNRRISLDNHGQHLRSTGTFPDHQKFNAQYIKGGQNLEEKKSQQLQIQNDQLESSQRFEKNIKQSIILNNNSANQNNQQNNQNSQINNFYSNQNEIESLFGTFNNQQDANIAINQSSQIPHNQSQTYTANFNSQYQPLSSNRLQLLQQQQQSFIQQNQLQDQGVSFNLINSNHNLFQTPEKNRVPENAIQNNSILNQTPFATVNINSSPIAQNKNNIHQSQQLGNPSSQYINTGQNRIFNSSQPQQHNDVQEFSMNQDYQSIKSNIQEEGQNHQQQQFPLKEIIKAERDSLNHYYNYRDSEKHTNPYEPNQAAGDYVTQFQYKQYQLQNSQMKNQTSQTSLNHTQSNFSIYSPDKNKQKFQQNIDQQNEYQINIQPPVNQQTLNNKNREPILIQNQEDDVQSRRQYFEKNKPKQGDQNEVHDRSQYFKRPKSPQNPSIVSSIVSSSKLVYSQQVKIQ